MYLSAKASRGQLRVAENVRRNRLEILKALSQGQITRRELLKWGLFTGAGLLALKNGLSPFVSSALASSNIPTGLPASPLFGVQDFSNPMPRMDVLPRHPDPFTFLSPAPTKEANTTQRPVPAVLGGGTGPIEGRPPGPIWAHQRFENFPPAVAIDVAQEGAKVNTAYNPQVAANLNSGIDPATPFPPRFHPDLPDQGPLALWTFNGTLPPKLMIGRYHEPLLFRHHNRLPEDPTQNGGFGIHTISTHEHNGHHGAENDGFTGAYFYPGEFYDYHYPIVLAGINTINTAAMDPRAGTPDGSGGILKIPGDWRETMSTHWFHDHMFSFTSQNVYKGNAGMFNIYSALDRGNEAINDGVNLRLPSGTAKDFGNLDYDVNLMLADKAWDQDGQLLMDIFDFDGFLGDRMTVNLVYKPYYEVERRKYRFRILNASVSRFFKVALSDGSPMIQIANDGNLLPSPVVLTQLDEQGIAERYDIIIDFSRYSVGSKVWMVNLAEHDDGRRVATDLTLAEALSGNSSDPCVGRFLEFRIVRDPAQPDVSQVPDVLIPNPDLSQIPVAHQRTFEFNRGAAQTTSGESSFFGPWGIETDNRGGTLAADFGRVSAAPRSGTREIWTLKNGGGGWDHPIHIHFEEGQVLARDGKAANVPAWERGRKDVYRLRPGGSITITLQFRDFGGMFMEHCHNTVHEDNAMLLRWEIDDGGAPFLRPLPTPIPSAQGVVFVPPTGSAAQRPVTSPYLVRMSEGSMNSRGSLLTGTALALLVAAMANEPGPGGAAAQAAETAATLATASSVLVPIRGTVGGAPESVAFSGSARLGVSVVTDPDFGAPATVRLSIDLSQMVGVGSSTGKTYLTRGREVVARQLAAADLVQISFPFVADGEAVSSAQVGVASFNLGFNVDNGALTGASAEVLTGQ